MRLYVTRMTYVTVMQCCSYFVSPASLIMLPILQIQNFAYVHIRRSGRSLVFVTQTEVTRRAILFAPPRLLCTTQPLSPRRLFCRQPHTSNSPSQECQIIHCGFSLLQVLLLLLPSHHDYHPPLPIPQAPLPVPAPLHLPLPPPPPPPPPSRAPPAPAPPPTPPPR